MRGRRLLPGFVKNRAIPLRNGFPTPIIEICVEGRQGTPNL